MVKFTLADPFPFASKLQELLTSVPARELTPLNRAEEEACKGLKPLIDWVSALDDHEFNTVRFHLHNLINVANAADYETLKRLEGDDV